MDRIAVRYRVLPSELLKLTPWELTLNIAIYQRAKKMEQWRLSEAAHKHKEALVLPHPRWLGEEP